MVCGYQHQDCATLELFPARCYLLKVQKGKLKNFQFSTSEKEVHHTMPQIDGFFFQMGNSEWSCGIHYCSKTE